VLSVECLVREDQMDRVADRYPRSCESRTTGSSSSGFIEATSFATADRHLMRGAGFRVQGSGSKGQGSGCWVQGSGFRVQGSGFRVQGLGCRVLGFGVRVSRLLVGAHVTRISSLSMGVNTC